MKCSPEEARCLFLPAAAQRCFSLTNRVSPGIALLPVLAAAQSGPVPPDTAQSAPTPLTEETVNADIDPDEVGMDQLDGLAAEDEDPRRR